MSITILKILGKSTILENNIVQTVGSAGESIAAAVVFTVPALIFLGYALDAKLTLLIAMTGGVFGVLMMIPLRRYLIVKEHGNFRFPEGTACAEILKAGEVGGTSASKIFKGMGIGAIFKAFPTLFGFWKTPLNRDIPFYRGSTYRNGCCSGINGSRLHHRISNFIDHGSRRFVIFICARTDPGICRTKFHNSNLSWHINHS